jgi:hypothetical protein
VERAELELLGDPVAEGRRIAAAAATPGLPLRVMGGVAVAMLCPSSAEPPLARQYADIDLATTNEAKDEVVILLESLGYVGDRELNMLHGHRRLFFWDESNARQLDVFVDEARLCHRIGFKRRIKEAPFTLPLADLAVLKLQVMETNEKDYLDICAIFADHNLTSDEDGINSAYIASLCAADWGLWRTLGLVAERSERFALDLSDFRAADVVADRLRRLRRELDNVSKTRAWKLRSRIGDRRRWYELPEEVH